MRWLNAGVTNADLTTRLGGLAIVEPSHAACRVAIEVRSGRDDDCYHLSASTARVTHCM